jgi:hypothetical protein
MKELHGARRALVKSRVATRNRDHTHRSALLKRQARARLAQIERQILRSTPPCTLTSPPIPPCRPASTSW